MEMERVGQQLTENYVETKGRKMAIKIKKNMLKFYNYRFRCNSFCSFEKRHELVYSTLSNRGGIANNGLYIVP